MKTDTTQKIVDFVEQQKTTSPNKIILHLGITPAAVFRHLNKLIKDGRLVKLGSPPKVFYTLPDSAQGNAKEVKIRKSDIVNSNFLKISPDGIMQTGSEAFVNWCLTRGLNPNITLEEYEAIIKKFDGYGKGGLIDGLPKLRKTFKEVYLDEMYYLDFYSIERFGKTKLGELVLYAKQSQSKDLVKLIVSEIRNRVLTLIDEKQVDAIGFVPPTIKRQVQFMKELERLLNLPLPTIKITKIKTPITVPQKTLSKLEERVKNARNSIVVEDESVYNTILLIDDAVGSGATINETAKQIKHKNLCRDILIGLGVTGSFSGFDIIHEV